MKSSAQTNQNRNSTKPQLEVANGAATEAVSNTRAGQTKGLTQEDLKILKATFPKDRLGVKVQSVSRERTRAMLVLYLQHTDVQDRLEEVDPSWSTEVISETLQGDTVYVRLRLTLKGISRENVGEGQDPKAAYSDALKRCAMLFGVGRYLYDSVTVWTEYNESRDRFRQWSIEDYEHAANQARKRSAGGSTKASEAEDAATPAGPGLATRVTPKPQRPAAPASASARSREELNRVLMNLYRPYLAKFPQTQFGQLLQGRYNVSETRLMTTEQLEDLVQLMEAQLKSVA